MTDLLVTMPVSGRWTVTRAVLLHLRHVESELDGVSITTCLMADREHRANVHVALQLADGCGLGDYDSVSEKHNALVWEAVQSRTPDLWMHLCDDDAPSVPYIRKAIDKLMGKGVDVCRMMSMAMVDVSGDPAYYVSDGLPGSGTMMTYNAVQDLGFRPWHGAPRDKKLDARMYENVQRADLRVSGILSSPNGKSQLIALKGCDNMWSMDQHMRLIRKGNPGLVPDPIDGPAFVEQHAPKVADVLDME